MHLKRPEARKLRLLLSSRQMLLRTRIDLDNHIRGVLKALRLKVGKVATGQFEARVWSCSMRAMRRSAGSSAHC